MTQSSKVIIVNLCSDFMVKYACHFVYKPLSMWLQFKSHVEKYIHS